MQEAIQYLTAKDPVFKQIVAQYGMPVIPKRPQGFETLVLLILEQQVSIDSAKATFLKLKNLVAKIQPEILITLADEDFREVGISRQKTAYIKGLAAAVIQKEIHIEGFAQQSAQEVREALIKIKGIGNWTIDVYLMFCLQAPDIIPLGDIAVVNTINELFGIHTKEAMQVHVEQWSPYQSAATFLLWHHYLNKRNRKVEY